MSDIVERLTKPRMYLSTTGAPVYDDLAVEAAEALAAARARIAELEGALEGAGVVVATLSAACQSALEQRIPPGDKADALSHAIARAKAWESSARLGAWMDKEIATARAVIKGE